MSDLVAGFSQLIEKKLSELNWAKSPDELYQPISYTMQLGAKRMRPVLLLLSAHLFGKNEDEAIYPACGIELFHNFTLLHDDIMDEAPLRRGKPTVFQKWNKNIAILSGDVMFVESCRLMSKVKTEVLKPVLDVFYESAIEVCEGQQYDINFETRNDVSLDAYLSMIEQKTAALLGAAMEIGAVIAQTSMANQKAVRKFGRHLGVAFQIMDDYLDLYGDEKQVGKRPGGDIVANKKTYLLLKALELASGDVKKELTFWFQTKHTDSELKIQKVKSLFDQLNVAEYARKEMEIHYSKALQCIHDLDDVDAAKKAIVISLAQRLMNRTS
jgi:geranylgeranyl diphosphate synthase type II